jgi:hypothetical protein
MSQQKGERMYMKYLGIVFLVLGAVILLFGINASQSVPDQVVEGFTGRFTSTTMLYIISGVILLAGGGYLLIVGSKK